MKRELHFIALLGCGALLVGCCLIGFTDNWLVAGQWLVQAGLLWAFACYCTWQRLPLNRSMEGAPLYATLGWGNRLTILRGALIALTGGFLFMGEMADVYLWIAAALYTFAAILDRVDGFVARRSRQVSLLGIELDTTFDALGLVVAPLLAIELGKMHWSYLLLSAAYYVYQWALRRRLRLGLPVYAVIPNVLRRTLAGCQMGFVAMVLWPVFDSSVTIIASVAFMLPVLIGFGVDWLVASGRINARNPAVTTFFSKLDRFSKTLFQPGLRVVLVMSLYMVMSISTFTHQYVFAAGLMLGLGLVLSGFAGRLGALVVLAFLGWHYPADTVNSAGYILIISASWVLLLGTGRFSLWQWDDKWVQRYDGA